MLAWLEVDMFWLWMLLALLLGAMVGIGIILYLHQGLKKRLKELETIQTEYALYKQDVTEHFVGTASLVNQLTKSYKAVYDHLEQGAYKLVGEEVLQKQLGNVSSEPVMLETIGQRKSLPKTPDYAETPPTEPTTSVN
jgi:uncharacterized protein